MRDATLAAIAFALAEHARTGFETDPERLGHLLGVRFIPGTEARASNGPPSIVTLPKDAYAPRQRFTTHHELGHILVQRSGLEDDIRAEVSEEDSEAHLELVVNFIAALLVMPQPLVRAIHDEHGDTPQSILALAQAARVSLPAAMHRWVSHDLGACRAAFLTSGSYISHIATCNAWLPFWRYDRVPELETCLPDVRMATAPNRLSLRVGVTQGEPYYYS
ncbi:ImmA/IrrE family metallo-endopeptidase [Deinococcus lacus]|uniref:ImmA/IrrE family metallo-endopeptidase n=1 Tax=Deinococcus lacus TaxID=392561 RepID=A0ABW1YG13_9DEIO